MPVGPAGFVAAMVNIGVLEFVSLTAWSLVFFVALMVIVPLVVVNAVGAFLMTKMGGTAAKVGRGMLVACATTVLTQVILGAMFVAIFAI
ncbi:hypothetical protein DVS77_28870 [Mycolicibacterium moriokaense]|nr:hypothetical protein DVS77_28870 [Mycolicibacterium moriokaense]